MTLILYFFIAYLYFINARIHRKVFLHSKKPTDYNILISGVDHEKVSGQDILNKFKPFGV